MIKYNMIIVRVLSKTLREIIINMANMSDWAFNDKVRIQDIDQKGNGEVYYVSPVRGTGDADISKVIRAINPVCDKRMDKFPLKSVVRI